MHVPASATAEVEVLSFEDALRGAEVPNPNYDIRKWLYVPATYDEYRYILGTKGSHPVICVGINPSTAAPDNLDPTLKSAQRIALSNGYDSFLMFNVYAQRATRPQDMEREMNPRMHDENMKAFRYLLSLGGARPAVWAAWGSIIEMRPYLSDCVRDMLTIGQDYGAVWYHAGPLSAKGHPHHPLYLRSDTPLEVFDTEAYLCMDHRHPRKSKIKKGN